MPQFDNQISIIPGTNALVVQTSGGTPLFVIDNLGRASVRDYTFVLARGISAATGTGVTNSLIVTRPGKIVKASIYALTAPTGAAFIVDINKNGTSIWNSTQSNRVQLAAGATSGTQANFDTTTIAEGDILTIDVDQVGSTVPGQDITVVLTALMRNQS